MTPFPIVLSDEANYLLPTLFGYTPQNFARWNIISQVPAVLYYRTYSQLSGPGIYEAAKTLNAAFIVAAAFPAYAIARPFLAPPWAVTFAAIVVCAPICTFTRYFMPESSYYFGFWCVTYVALRTVRHSLLFAGLATGSALGVLSLVKPHALALLLGVALFFVLRSGRKYHAILAGAALAIAFYVTRVGAGYAVSGIFAYSITGPTYGSLLSVTRFQPSALFFNVVGHTAALVLLAGLPLAALGTALIKRRRQPNSEAQDLMLLALCLLAVMVAMTVYFSYNVYMMNPSGEGITRLHGRYFAFALPLPMLAFVVLVRNRWDTPELFAKGSLVGFGLAAIASALILSGLYQTSVVDYPELGIFTRWPNGLVIPGIAGFACVITTLLLRRKTNDGCWQRALPVVWWAAILVSTSFLLLAAPLAGKWFVPNAVDRAMMSDPLALALRNRDDGMIVGTAGVEVDTFRIMFHLASRSRGRIIGPDVTLTRQEIPGDVRWLVLLPGVSFSGTEERQKMGPLTLVHLR